MAFVIARERVVSGRSDTVRRLVPTLSSQATVFSVPHRRSPLYWDASCKRPSIGLSYLRKDGWVVSSGSTEYAWRRGSATGTGVHNVHTGTGRYIIIS